MPISLAYMSEANASMAQIVVEKPVNPLLIKILFFLKEPNLAAAMLIAHKTCPKSEISFRNAIFLIAAVAFAEA
ncbi:MAG: hypothetical protein HC850_13125 [Rhodomicrobium sp.]|nr:hypothetical protein [Rhodomicrobium sp.]